MQARRPGVQLSNKLFPGVSMKMTGGAAEKQGGEAQKKKRMDFFVALKISIAYGFFVCNTIAKMKYFYIVFCSFDVFL